MRASRFGLILLVWAVSAQTISSAATLSDALDAFGVQQPRVQKPAPAFSLPQLGGGTHALVDERGRVVLLHFWATWCVACRHEMPQIESLWQQYRDRGLVVLGVNVDRGSAAGVQAFVHERNLSFPSVLDSDGTVRNRYEVRGLPTTYLIGRDGRIIGRIIGERDWSGDAAKRVIQSLIQNREKGDETKS